MVYMRTNKPSRVSKRCVRNLVFGAITEVQSDLKSLYEFHEQGVHLVRPLALNPMSGSR
jgi:hypothetical protein